VKLGSIGLSQPHLDNDERARLLELRLQYARQNQHWTEVDEVALVRRPFGLLIGADDDSVYRAFRGAVFAGDEVRSSFAAETELSFYVRDGQMVFLERVPGTWSEHVARRAKRGALA
jgi:hypothetical protein